MSGNLIVYATREGQTELIANRIAEHWRAHDVDVLVHNASEPLPADAGGFDLVLYGASMHAGGLESELIDFIRTQHDRLAPARTAFFLVLLSAATKDPELREKWLGDARAKMESQLPIRFEDVEMIAGALKYSKYPWPLKWVMRKIAKQAGEGTDLSKDYEYTDWNQVESYARRLLSPR